WTNKSGVMRSLCLPEGDVDCMGENGRFYLELVAK
ncbi:hypothetical protein Tco_1060503, partial [Tanacetum coccineum]